MISFVNKTVTTVVKTPGKRVSAKVVWKNNRFYAKRDSKYYEIDKWDDLSNSRYIYALPTNTYFTPWHRKLYSVTTDATAISLLLRFWGKYKHGDTIYGKIVDTKFYESRISKDTKPV